VRVFAPSPTRSSGGREPGTSQAIDASHVAFLIDAVFPFDIGGRQTYIHQVARRLAAEGRNVDVYTMNWWKGARRIHIDGITFHALCRLHPLYEGKRRSTKQALAFGLASLSLLTRRFDVLCADSMPFFPLFSAKLVCLLRRRRLYATWHEVWTNDYWKNYLGRLGGLGYAAERLAMRLPKEIISNSAHTSERLRGLDPELKVRTVELGIDFDQIAGVGPSGASSDVIYAGRLLPNKNIDQLVRAIGILRTGRPAIRAVIVGQGPERPSLERLVSELGLRANIEFVDFMANHDDLFSLMKSSKVFVLPSEREGFGLVVLEANACGLPVVTVRHPENAAQRLILEGENGFVTSLDAAGLAQATLRCLGRPKGLDPLSVVQERFAGNNWSAVARRFAFVLDGGDVEPPNGNPGIGGGGEPATPTDRSHA
jgi:glycosyltransferase involved in cell wall biosynthesis